MKKITKAQVKEFAEGLLEVLRKYNTMHTCLKAKCCFCPHCANCDVDDEGKIEKAGSELGCG